MLFKLNLHRKFYGLFEAIRRLDIILKIALSLRNIDILLVSYSILLESSIMLSSKNHSIYVHKDTIECLRYF